MARLGILLTSVVLLMPAAARAQTDAPPAGSASTSPALGGCLKDVDCKGDRICVQGVCTAPSAPPPLPPPPPATSTPTPPAAPAPAASPTPAAPAETPAKPPSDTNWAPRGTAAPRAAPPPPSSWRTVGQRGFEIQFGGGVFVPSGSSPVKAPNFYPSSVRGDAVGAILEGPKNCGNADGTPYGDCAPYGASPLGLAVKIGYRFFPWLSVGASFTYAEFSALNDTNDGDSDDSTSQLVRQMWTVGAYGRYYITQYSSRLQPWVELGANYSDDNASYVRGGTQTNDAQPETQAYYLSEKGLDIRLTAGLDWRLAPVFTVGPWLGYERVIPLQACVEIDVDSSAAAVEQQFSGQKRCSSPPVEGSGYGVFSAGIFAKLTFDPFKHAAPAPQ